MSNHPSILDCTETSVVNREHSFTPLLPPMKVEILSGVSPTEVLKPLYLYLMYEVFPVVPAVDVGNILHRTKEILQVIQCPLVHDNQCTEKCIIATLQNSIRYPEACSTVIEMLVNYPNNGIISERVLNFTQNHMTDKILVTRRNKNLPSKTSFSVVHRLFLHPSLCFSKHITTKNQEAPSFPLAMILTAVALVLIVTFVLLLTTNFQASSSVIRMLKITNPLRKKMTYNITTYSQHQVEILADNFDTEIELEMSIEDSEVLNESLKIDKKILIDHLTIQGPITITSLINILGRMPNVKNLSIKNTNTTNCTKEENKDGVHLLKVTMENTRYLKLEGLASCSGLYDKISEYIRFTHLQSLEIRNGSIDLSNIKTTTNLIMNSRNSLHSITFANTKVLSTAISNELVMLPNLKYLGLNLIDEIYNERGSITDSIAQIFPNLQIFESHSGYMTWEQFEKLANCKNLTSVTTGLKMLPGVSNVDLSHITTKFTNLRQLFLVLSFEKVTLHDGCIFEGEEELKKKLQQFHIQSNCPRINIHMIK